jgi:hypothetical protein
LPARPVTGLIVLGVGVFCLALVPLLHWYVLPRVEVLPLDENTTSVSTGVGTYFDEKTLKTTGPVQFTATTHILGDVAAGEATGHAVWNISTTVDTPASLQEHDPRQSLVWRLERWVGDRSTAQPVNCCGASPHFTGNAYLKFPFNLHKGTYDYWSPLARQSFPVRYTDTVDMSGVQLYRFLGTVPPTRMGSTQVPGKLVGLQSTSLTNVDEYYRDDGTEVDVDPVSGIPVVTVQRVVTTLHLPGSAIDRLTVLTATFITQQASRDSLLALVKSTDDKLDLVRQTMPKVLLTSGSLLVLLDVGLVVSAVRRRRRTSR